MNHLVIGIPTYKRPEMLQKLVRSIYVCNLDKHLIDTVDLIVVDNDFEKSALKVIPELKRECPTNFGFEYFNYSEKGLSNVRNEILKTAYSYSPDFIIFIDDDEYASPDWLNNLLLTAVNHNADMVIGPVIPVYDSPVSKFISTWFNYGTFDNGQQLDVLYGTGNLLMKTQFLKEHLLSFDPRFNLSGGEDTFFGVEALKKGAKILWSKKALVYETIPAKRANLKWLVKRNYRGATTYTYILKLKKDYFGLIKKFIVSGIYLIIGILTIPTMLLPIKKKYWSILKIVEGLGGFAGMLNFRYQEYS